MTLKAVAVSALIAVILTVVIRAILRASGIHNFLSYNSTGGFLLYWLIFSMISLVLIRRPEIRHNI